MSPVGLIYLLFAETSSPPDNNDGQCEGNVEDRARDSTDDILDDADGLLSKI